MLCWNTSQFSASPCSWTGNQQDCKHRNNNQQAQMFKAGSYILDKVKRVSGRRVIIRLSADIKGQCGEGSWAVLSACCEATRLLPPQSSQMMRKQSEHKISTTEQGHFRRRTIPELSGRIRNQGRVPINPRARKALPLRTRTSFCKNVWRGVFDPVIWDWVGDNRTVGTHPGITWCNLDSISIMDPISLIMDMGRAGRESVPADISRTMPLRAAWFSTQFWSRKQFFKVNSPSTYQRGVYF